MYGQEHYETNVPQSNPNNQRDFDGYYRDSPDGVAFGGSWSSGKDPTGANVNEIYGNFGMGKWTDRDGVENKGIAVDGGMTKMGEELGKGPLGLGWDFGGGTFNAGATTNKNTTGIGAGANMLEGSVTTGNAEENARFGLSAGVGAGLRAHHGDADGDGAMELGFGVDLGPASFDIKSETAGEIYNMRHKWGAMRDELFPW
jgi:hypothetical protein